MELKFFSNAVYACCYYKGADYLAQADLNRFDSAWYFSRLVVPKGATGDILRVRIIDKLIEWARDNEFTIVLDTSLYVTDSVDNLKEFYIKAGFSEENNILYFGDYNAVEKFVTIGASLK